MPALMNQWVLIGGMLFEMNENTTCMTCWHHGVEDYLMVGGDFWHWLINCALNKLYIWKKDLWINGYGLIPRGHAMFQQYHCDINFLTDKPLFRKKNDTFSSELKSLVLADIINRYQGVTTLTYTQESPHMPRVKWEMVLFSSQIYVNVIQPTML